MYCLVLFGTVRYCMVVFVSLLLSSIVCFVGWYSVKCLDSLLFQNTYTFSNEKSGICII